jgi:prepilin-type N-terminal cleavage/methylation domain-containing protein
VRRAIPHLQREAGFSLIELLVVVLVIGILAGIALPIFLDQRRDAQDADAKSNARNMAGQLESCYVTSGAFDAPACLPPETTGLPVGVAPGKVGVEAPGAERYVITARSRSGTAFVIERKVDGDRERTCTRPGVGGCADLGGRGVW